MINRHVKLGVMAIMLSLSHTILANDNVSGLAIQQCKSTYEGLTGNASRIELNDAQLNASIGMYSGGGESSASTTEIQSDARIVPVGQVSPEPVITSVGPELNSQRYRFFDLKPKDALSERIYTDDSTGEIYFKMKVGSLRSNIDSFIKETRSTKGLLWCVSNSHQVSVEHWAKGNSTKSVASKIVGAYKQPDQILFGLMDGETVAVYYRNDKELRRCK